MGFPIADVSTCEAGDLQLDHRSHCCRAKQSHYIILFPFKPQNAVVCSVMKTQVPAIVLRTLLVPTASCVCKALMVTTQFLAVRTVIVNVMV